MARGKTLDQKGIGAEPSWDETSQPLDDDRSIVKIKKYIRFHYFKSSHILAFSSASLMSRTSRVFL